MKVALVACSSMKAGDAQPARALYTSPLFTKSLRYALAIAPEATWIMSAAHHLLPLDRVVEPYNAKLSDIGKARRIWWGIDVVDSLALALRARGVSRPQLVLLGGEDYNGPIRGAAFRKEWPTPEEPLRGMNIGHRLQWLNRATPPPPGPIAIVEESAVVFECPAREFCPASVPVHVPTEPYVTQYQSPLGWSVQLFDPQVSTTQPVRTERPLKKFTHVDKRKMVSLYKFAKEKNDAQNDH